MGINRDLTESYQPSVCVTIKKS